jgi:hypothetical protein
MLRLTPVFAQEMGRQTRQRLTVNTPQNEDFFSKATGLLPFLSMQMPYSEDPL